MEDIYNEKIMDLYFDPDACSLYEWCGCGTGERDGCRHQSPHEKGCGLYEGSRGEKALAEFKNPKGKFVHKDLVIWCVDLEGVALVHPTTALIGKNLFELRDADGKYFIKEEIAIAKANGGGTMDYRWTNLKTKKIERKRAFFEVVDDVIVNCGYFI